MSDEAGKCPRSKGRDGLRRTGHRQLSFVFADSPDGGGSDGPPDASERRAFLLQRAKRKRSARTVAWAADTSRLLEEVASEANLALALLNVVRNKGAPGVDGQTVEEAEAEAPKLLARLRRALLEGRYRPGDVRRVFIPKPGGGQRGSGHPQRRGPGRATGRAPGPGAGLRADLPSPAVTGSGRSAVRTRPSPRQRSISKPATGRSWISISAKFFDRVHHQRLLDRIGQRVADRRVIALVRLMLKAAVVMPDGTRIVVREGTPQGGPLSPLLSNIVLDELDQELARRGHRFVRYADDCNVFVRSERAGARVMASIRQVPGDAHAAPGQRGEECRAPSEQGALPGVPLSARGEDGQIGVLLSAKTERRLAATMQGDDASELGAIHHHLHGRLEPLPDRMDGALPALFAGRRQGSGRSRRSHPPPDQGDHRAPEEASALSSAAPAGARGEPIGRCRRCVLRTRGLEPLQPAGLDASLPAVLVHGRLVSLKALGRAQHPRRHRTSSRWPCDRSTQRAGCGPACPVL